MVCFNNNNQSFLICLRTMGNMWVLYTILIVDPILHWVILAIILNYTIYIYIIVILILQYS